MVPTPPNPSGFFLLNEEIAAEMHRLESSGHLDPLKALLKAAGAELQLSALLRKEGLEELVGALSPSHWDSENFLPVRSRFTVRYPDGQANEVYMPDHVCPSCWNATENKLASCARVCGACGFSW